MPRGLTVLWLCACRGERPDEQFFCPSSPPKPGAVLLGAIVGDSTAYIRPRVTVSERDLAAAGAQLEWRFRFAQPCLRGECRNYALDRCGLIESFVRAELEPAPEALRRKGNEKERLPSCSIRRKCQWSRTARHSRLRDLSGRSTSGRLARPAQARVGTTLCHSRSRRDARQSCHSADSLL